MRAFVIRPFRKSDSIGFDPDLVHRELIAPALAQTGYIGGTSAEISDSGSVPERMIQEIIDADLVIADITVHNANVFYELGVRHALRPTGTILIRARLAAALPPVAATSPTKVAPAPGALGPVAPAPVAPSPVVPAQPSLAPVAPAPEPRQDVPFDIQGWSYEGYDPAQPGLAVDALVQVIRSARVRSSVDSPVFRLFPSLVVDASGWDRLPLDLAEEIDVLRNGRELGGLRLLAEEVTGSRFEESALRQIAEAQEQAGDPSGACMTWESLLHRRRNDHQVNRQLSTIYSRLDADSSRSDKAIERALSGPKLPDFDVAELHALRGRNRKDAWKKSWKDKKQVAERQHIALRSALLDDSIDAYLGGFRRSIDHYYSGINALALIDIQLRLQQLLPAVWSSNFANETAAEHHQQERERERQWLISAVGVSLDRARRAARWADIKDPWLDATVADHLLSSSAENHRIVAAYERAAFGLGPKGNESVLRQFEIFELLGLEPEAIKAARSALSPQTNGRAKKERPIEFVLFAGHMVDTAKAAEPRFPASLEPAVEAALQAKLIELQAEAKKRKTVLVGIAPASAGGDLLFHLVCHHLHISTEVFLPVPDGQLRNNGVIGNGTAPIWLDRYRDVIKHASKVRVLNRRPDLPSWRDGNGDEAYDWERTKRWMFHEAKARSEHVTALVLTDGATEGTRASVFGFVEHAGNVGVPVYRLLLAELRGQTDPS
jgi:hypothetical protein